MIYKKHLKFGLIGAIITATIVASTIVPLVSFNQKASNANNSLIKYSTADSISSITLKTNYPQNIYVHEFMDIVNPNGFVSIPELNLYFDFIDVPPNSGYEIDPNPTYNYASGNITLKIRMEKYYVLDADGVTKIIVDAPSQWYTFTIVGLLARITSVEQRNDYDKNIIVNKVAELIFNEDNTVNDLEMKKFAKIEAPAPNAKLNLVNGYNIDTGEGTLAFDLFYDKYYGADGELKTQTQSNIAKSYNFNLTMKAVPSVITSKATYTANHRVDKFIAAFTDVSGNVINETVLKQYVDIENMPNGYTLKIDTVNIIDEQAGTISFNVIASHYNNHDSVVNRDGVFPIQLKLTGKFPPTVITEKPEGAYDDTIRVDRFIKYVSNDDNTPNLIKLAEFLKMDAIPADAIVTYENIVPTNATGIITFEVVLNKYYTGDSVLTPGRKSFPITLELTVRFNPTVIAGVPNIVGPERIDRFAEKITELSGTPALLTYLNNKYITITGDVPAAAKFSVTFDWLDSDEINGLFVFDLIVSEYYDADADLKTNGVFEITLKLRVKYPTTNLTVKNEIVGHERIDYFENTIKILKNQDLVEYLNDYIDGTKTLVIGASLSASVISVNVKTGDISFKLITNKYYNSDSEIIMSPKEFSFSLKLSGVFAPTTIKAKNEIFSNIIVDQFIPQITNDQLVVDNMEVLNKYVVINSLPQNAQLSIKDINMLYASGDIRFKLVTNKFYDADGDLVTDSKKEFIVSLVFGAKHVMTTITINYDYNQSENVQDFVDNIKTLTQEALITYLNTYITIGGDISSTTDIFVNQDTITYDLTTGKVHFDIIVTNAYAADGTLLEQVIFPISLILAH